MELNREQIIKALECCISGDDCTLCPLRDEQSCPCVLNENALALIKELTEECERLKAENGRYEAENNAKFDKWLKLEEATKRHHAELFKDAKMAVKEDTVRKMQELVKTQCRELFSGVDVCMIVDQIAKELIDSES